MQGEIIELTDANFDSHIKKGNWVVDYWAEWCMPCKVMEPHFEATAKKYKGKVNFGKVNVEENQGLSERFQVMSIPTTIFFKEKEQVNRVTGAIDENELKELIDESF